LTNFLKDDFALIECC